MKDLAQTTFRRIVVLSIWKVNLKVHIVLAIAPIDASREAESSG